MSEELRTLKDIGNNLIGVKHSQVFPMIKAEAVKLLKKRFYIHESYGLQLKKEYAINTNPSDIIKDFIKFFNLTEEELGE